MNENKKYKKQKKNKLTGAWAIRGNTKRKQKNTKKTVSSCSCSHILFLYRVVTFVLL